MFKFIHCADIHLDSPLRGLERYEGAPVEEIRLATRRALENMVMLARAEGVHFVLIAGDLFDGDWKDYNTGLFFVNQMALLRDAGIRVVIIAGNHDADGKMTRALKWPDNVKVLSSRRPETEVLSDIGVAVHGQSFASASVTEDLSRSYPDPQPGLFNIGLLHTAVDGREGHAPYAPCTLSGLRARNYDYWALGHVHNREILAEKPLIVFPGNIQGRHIRETGAKGCILAEVDDRGSVSVQFEALDVLRWEHLKIEASDAATADELLQLVAEQALNSLRCSDGRPLAVRVEFVGTTPIDSVLKQDMQRWTNEVRAAAIDYGGGRIWIEKVKFRTSAPSSEAPVEHIQGPLAELSSVIQELREDPAALSRIMSEWAELRNKLPAEVKDGSDVLQADNPDAIAGFLDEVESLLSGRLLAGGGKR